LYKHYTGFHVYLFHARAAILWRPNRGPKGKEEREMKRLLAALLAVAMFLGMTSGSYAANDNAGPRKQDTPLVVNNGKGENIGTIRGALEDQMGEIAFVIVSLQDQKIGKKDVVVPVNAFSQDGKNGKFVLDLSDETLASAPEFNASKLGDPAYAEGLYKFYGQTPPWVE
jgi:hypothetical protein